MRFTITLPSETVEQLRQLADTARRPVRNHCEYLIIQAANNETAATRLESLEASK